MTIPQNKTITIKEEQSRALPLSLSNSQTLPRSTRLNSLPLHHGTTINLSEAADSGYESDAEVYL